eukprot:5850899-Pyramimonas_sp.AAC.1
MKSTIRAAGSYISVVCPKATPAKFRSRARRSRTSKVTCNAVSAEAEHVCVYPYSTLRPSLSLGLVIGRLHEVTSLTTMVRIIRNSPSSHSVGKSMMMASSSKLRAPFPIQCLTVGVGRASVVLPRVMMARCCSKSLGPSWPSVSTRTGGSRRVKDSTRLPPSPCSR